jgi:hypothetical protein
MAHRAPFDYQARAQVARDAKAALRHVKGADDYNRAVAAWKDTVTAAYPAGFWEAVEQLRAGNPTGVEPALAFLMADPWFFRTGYLKQDLLRWLRRHPLSASQANRLRGVIVNAIRSRDRREFREYIHAACWLDSPSFRREISELIQSPDTGVRRRAGWVLHALEHHGAVAPRPWRRTI